MPLHVDIRINHQMLTQVHIGRFAGGEHPDDVNTYRAVVTAPNGTPDFFTTGSVEFTHRYGDGALACTQRALEALQVSMPQGL